MIMHKALHSRDNTDKFCVIRKEGVREHASVEDCVDAAIQRTKNMQKEQWDINYRNQ